MTRTFEANAAKRERVPLLIGLYGPSGSGKTMSALRLATGIQRVAGGDIYGCDSESRRMLHYAERFKFLHVPFGPPFSPSDYLAMLEFCAGKGARTIIVDSMSHEHEGPGGVLEMHDKIMQELATRWKTSVEKTSLTAWAEPKAQRRRLVNTILQMNCNFIFCFRAKEKIKPVSGGQPIQLGWMPIAGDDYVYEMTLNCLLQPASGGVPDWHPTETGEKLMIKKPDFFVDIFAERQPLSEDIGEKLARWAEGGANGVKVAAPEQVADLKKHIKRLKWTKPQWSAFLSEHFDKANGADLTTEEAVWCMVMLQAFEGPKYAAIVEELRRDGKIKEAR